MRTAKFAVQPWNSRQPKCPPLECQVSEDYENIHEARIDIISAAHRRLNMPLCYAYCWFRKSINTLSSLDIMASSTTRSRTTCHHIIDLKISRIIGILYFQQNWFFAVLSNLHFLRVQGTAHCIQSWASSPIPSFLMSFAHYQHVHCYKHTTNTSQHLPAMPSTSEFLLFYSSSRSSSVFVIVPGVSWQVWSEVWSWKSSDTQPECRCISIHLPKIHS